MPAGRWRPAATGCGGQGMTWGGRRDGSPQPLLRPEQPWAATTARFRLRKLFTKASLGLVSVSSPPHLREPSLGLSAQTVRAQRPGAQRARRTTGTRRAGN